MFTNDHERAVAYAAFKTLERMLEKDGDLPPGFYCDLTGESMTITLPKGSVVERDRGTMGNGKINKRATQNLYGFALWALLIHKLKKFNQWSLVKSILIDCMQEMATRKSNLKDQIVKDFPAVAREMVDLQEKLEIPCREEDTPRVFKETKHKAGLVFSSMFRKSA